MYNIYDINLQLFAGNLNTQVTSAEGMTPEMKVYYSDYLIDLVEPELVHDQFGQGAGQGAGAGGRQGDSGRGGT